MKESECGNAYKVLFLTAKGKEKMLMRPFTPYEGLYLVGDATPPLHLYLERYTEYRGDEDFLRQAVRLKRRLADGGQERKGTDR